MLVLPAYQIDAEIINRIASVAVSELTQEENRGRIEELLFIRDALKQKLEIGILGQDFGEKEISE